MEKVKFTRLFFRAAEVPRISATCPDSITGEIVRFPIELQYSKSIYVNTSLLKQKIHKDVIWCTGIVHTFQTGILDSNYKRLQWIRAPLIQTCELLTPLYCGHMQPVQEPK